MKSIRFFSRLVWMCLAATTLSAQGPIVYTPSTLTFPTIPAPTTPVSKISVEEIVVITNSSKTTPANISGSYSYPSDYAVNPNPATSLTVGCGLNLSLGPLASCALGVIHTPTNPPTVDKFFPNTLAIVLCPPCDGVTFYNLPLVSPTSTTPVPVLTFSPNQLIFAPTAAGATSAPITVTVTNVGNAVATISSLPPTSGNFSRTGGTCATTIAANGGTCTMNIVFSPPANAVAGKTLYADSTASPANPLLINLQGSTTGFALNASGAVAAPAPVSLTFTCSSPSGSNFSCSNNPNAPPTITMTGKAGASDVTGPTVFISNPSATTSVTISDITATNPPAPTPPFLILDKVNNCRGVTLAPGGGLIANGNSSCTFDVYFRPPATVAALIAEVDVFSTANGISTKQAIPFNARSTAAAGPILTVSPNSSSGPVSFSSTVGVPVSQTFELSNTGDQPLAVKGINISANENGFSLGSLTSCFKTFQPGDSCFVQVTFNPPNAGGNGTYNNSLVITTDVLPQVTVNLTGGVPVPAVSIDHTTLTILAPVGGTAVQTVTLKSVGTAPLQIMGVAIGSGPNNPTGFTMRNNTCLGKVIQPTNSCQIDFVFDPSVKGPETNSVTITDNASSTPPITLLGGISGPAFEVSPATSPISFDFILGQAPPVVTFTLTSVGSQPTTVQNITLQNLLNGFVLSSSDPTGCVRTLSAAPPGKTGDSCSFQLKFNAPDAYADNATTYPNVLTIATDAHAPVIFDLIGVFLLQPPPAVFPQTGSLSPLGCPSGFEPVDGGTGQYYEDELDFNLGGPMNFQFARYYGSTLSAGGYKSSMGTNWMNNFDIGVAMNGSNAQVMFYGGQVVNFTKSGGAWNVTSPANVVYQFKDTPTGFQSMSPVSNLIYTFNVSGKLTQIADRRGNSLTVTQGPNGPAAISDGLGRKLTLTYTGGQLTGITDQAGRSVQYSYSGSDLVSFQAADQQTTKYVYTTVGSSPSLMTQKIPPMGTPEMIQTYDNTGKVISQVDAFGNVRTYSYDGKGGNSVTSPLGGVSQQGYTTTGAVGKLTDPVGNSSILTYDNLNRRTSATERTGGMTKFTYDDASGRLASITDEGGTTTSYTYTPQTLFGFTFRNLTAVTYPDGTQSSVVFDAQGNTLSRTGTDGQTYTFSYDSNNRVASTTDTSQQTTNYTYDSGGNMASKTDTLGNVWSYAYDAAGLMAKITDPNGGITAMTYDPVNRPLTVTDPSGATTSSVYNANGLLISSTNPVGGVTKISYSGANQLASIADPLGNKTTYTYNPEGRLVTAANDAGEMLIRTYDSVGHVTQISGAEGLRMNYAWDTEAHILSQTDPTGLKFSYTYGPQGAMTGVTAPDGSTNTFSYDQRARLTSMTNPLGETTSVTLDGQGRKTKITLPGGVATTLQRDGLGALAGIVSPNGNAWTFSRDALGRIATVTDPLGNASTRSYTGGWLSGLTTPVGTVNYVRDQSGRVTQQQFSDGVTINSAWDPMGLLLSADGVSIQRNNAGKPVNVNGLALTYTSAGRLATITYAPGKAVNYAYDNAGRLSSISDWVGGQTAFTYDAASRIAGLTYPNSVATTYSYDANGRLSGIAMGSLGSINLTRDADDKITSADRNLPASPALQGQSLQFAYNAGSQLNGENYDAMGRALTQNGRTYTWNLASQLTGFQDSVTSGTLTYDGLGELASSNVTGATQNFVFNHATPLPSLSIVQAGGADLRYFVYGPDGSMLYSIEAADNSRKFYHFDELGNTVFLTGDDGSVTDTYGVTPYGENADHVGNADNPFTWQGQYGVMQEAQGLYFLRSRHYDASAGRFLSPDPVILPDPRSAEPYIYARSNPMGYNDPFGATSRDNLGALVSACEESNRGIDNGIPGPAEIAVMNQTGCANGFGLIVTSEDLAALSQYITNNPGSTWWQIHDGFSALGSSDVPGPPDKSVANAVSHCDQVGCLHLSPGASAQLHAELDAGLGNYPVPKAAQLLTQDGAGVVAQGAGNLIAQDGAGLAVTSSGKLIGHDGASLIGHDGASLIGHDGASLIGHDGASLIGHDGASLINQDGAGLIGHDGASLINQDGAGLINQDGAGVVGPVTGK